MRNMSYPVARKSDQVDNYHGTLVPDPYRWLEDDDTPETLEWVQRQNELTFSFLENNLARQPLLTRLMEIWDYPKASDPFERGGRYFQFRNTGLQNQDVLFVHEALKGEPRLILDPNKLSEDGTVALRSWSVSEDGFWLAYALSSSGSDWQEWRVRSVDTGIDLPEILEWSKFSGAAWRKDDSGFYYCRYSAPSEGETFLQANYNQQLFFHRLGTEQGQDILIYERPDHKEWGFGAAVSDDDRYLILAVWQGTDTRIRLFYQDLQSNGPVVELIDNLEAAYEFIGNDGAIFYFITDLNAPRGQIIAIDTANPGKEAWRTLVPQSDDALENAVMIHNEFILLYVHNASHCLRRFTIKGNYIGEITLPGLGSLIEPPSGERSDKELFFTFQSFVKPPTVFRFDFENEMLEVIWSPSIPFDFTPYLTRQVFVTSIDGTQVPLFLVHRQDISFDGDNPTILYGYGGFRISNLPVFSISRLAWFEKGGVLAFSCLRGGGEYGEDWHRAGMLHNKQNVFDDFISCARWLINQKITSSSRLAIQGQSNGGLLVGACLTQRPDLFGAALPAVGVMDMLRFHKFTIGWAWVSDYGCSDDPEYFKTLSAYSPLHNIKPGTQYPPTLVTTADHDDRVVPGHSFKFAATLQAAQAGEAPVLIRIQTKAGHGLGKPTRVIIEEMADIYAFLIQVFGMEKLQCP
jgi:prolyl oligopeptidase